MEIYLIQWVLLIWLHSFWIPQEKIKSIFFQYCHKFYGVRNQLSNTSEIPASWKLNSWNVEKQKKRLLFCLMWELITQSQWVPGPGTTTAETLKFLNRFTPAQSGNWFCNIFHFSGVYFCLQKPFCPAGKWHKTSWDIVVLTSNFSLTSSYKLPSLSILWLLLYIVV